MRVRFKSSKRPKADHRADTRGKPWAGIPHVVLDSLAFLHCDLWERAILVELIRALNGYNNGAIGLSQRQIAARLRSSNFRRIGRAIAGLMEKGLLDIEIEGRWKERQAREYRLTFVSTGSNGYFRPATNEYLNWQPPEKSGVEPASAEGAEAAARDSAGAETPAASASAGAQGKLSKIDAAAAAPVSSLISEPYPADEVPHRRTGNMWWTSDRYLLAQQAIMNLFASPPIEDRSALQPRRRPLACTRVPERS